MSSLAAAALAAAGPAQAAGERQIDLPAGTLEAALTALATQTGDQLVYAPEIVAGRKAPALSGPFVPVRREAVGPVAAQTSAQSRFSRIHWMRSVTASTAAPGAPKTPLRLPQAIDVAQISNSTEGIVPL